MSTFQLLTDKNPVLPMLGHQIADGLVFLARPSRFCLVGQSSKSAIAHLGRSVGDLIRNLAPRQVIPFGKFAQQSILVLRPWSPVVVVASLLQILGC